MFGKRLSESLSFQRFALGLLAAVGLSRLVLSLAGVPDATVVWLSMNAVGWPAALYYGVAVHKRGFGSYRQLLRLVINQAFVFHSIAVIGILLAIAGVPNIYAAPEYSGPAATNQWLHALAHLTIGMVAASLLWWGAASLVLFITKKVAGKPALA
jgi:hypothetical protein